MGVKKSNRGEAVSYSDVKHTFQHLVQLDLGMSQDIVSLLQPTVIALRICGVCPSALRRVNVPISTKVYGVLLAISFLVFIILPLPKTMPRVTDITTFFIVLKLISDIFRHLVLVLTAFTSSESLVKFFRIMESAQRSLFTLNIRQPPIPSRTTQLVWLAVLSTPKLLAFILLFLEGNYFHLLCFLPNTLVVTGTAAKMTVLLNLVSQKFELLNWHLDDLNNRWPVFLPRPPDVSFKELSCVREWRKTKFIVESEDNRTVTVEKINTFNKAHLKLVYAFNTLNSAFSFTCLAFILAGAIHLSFSIPLLLNINWASMSCYTVSTNLIAEIVAMSVVMRLSTKIQDQVWRETLFIVFPFNGLVVSYLFNRMFVTLMLYFIFEYNHHIIRA